MRDQAEDFKCGVMAGIAVAQIVEQLVVSSPPSIQPPAIHAKLLEMLDRPGLLAAIRSEQNCRMARDVWAAWRRAEQVKLVVTDSETENGSVET